MTLILIGPVCEDLIIIGDEKSSKVGGASFFQSFVYEEYFYDYLAIVNCSKKELIDEFPDKSKVKVILKEDTHYFINEYLNKENLDIRRQMTNFANIPITVNDLKFIFDEFDDNFKIDGFVLNPLNSNDLSYDTLNYLGSFNVPIYISLQGFLRFLNEDGSIELKSSDILDKINEISDSIFLDETEMDVLIKSSFLQFNVSNLIITNGSKGSRIIDTSNDTIKINAVKCDKIVDATGCGDTYMAAYISHRLNGKSLKESGDFASLIASKKLEYLGPYKR